MLSRGVLIRGKFKLRIELSVKRGWQRGGSNHTSRWIFLSNHASRVSFLTNHASRKTSKYTKLALYCKISTYRMYYWKLYCIQRFYPGMNCVSPAISLFVRQLKTTYLLKRDNQAVDKKNTEDHSPCENINYINLWILCYDCLDLPGRSKTSKVRRRSAKDGKDQKTVCRLLWFIDLC